MFPTLAQTPIWFYAPGIDPALAEASASVEAFLGTLGVAWRYGTALHWTLQAFLRLRPYSRQYRLTDQLPASGVLIAFRGSIPMEYRPPRGLLFVCICADAGPHPFAHLHLVQNPSQRAMVGDSHYVPHWPQFGIIPRSENRGDAFVNIDFFGDEPNLHPQLRAPEWQNFLTGLGCVWRLRQSEQWHDYHETDAVVAIRSYDGNEYKNKPASKLVNAWHAHVPTILGGESAYRSLRKGPNDYLEVLTFDETKAAILLLKENAGLRREMSRNGQRRAGEINFDTLIARWREFLDGVALPEFQRLAAHGPVSHAWFIGKRWLALRWRGLRARGTRLFTRQA